MQEGQRYQNTELAEVEAVKNHNNTTPSYSFNSTESGSISYGGGCESESKDTDNGTNSITFKTLSEETYDECWITVTDRSGNRSDELKLSSFRIDTTPPLIVSTIPEDHF